MGWYDLFSWTYDLQLEGLYRPWRAQLFDLLALQHGERVVDLACGTGQNLDGVAPAVGAEGRVVGVDLSSGMLARARARVVRHGWTHVDLVQADLTTLDAAALPDATPFDVALCTVGLEAIPDPDAVVARAWDLLRPGGRFGLMAVHAEQRTFQTWMVELLAQADLSRRTWEPVEARAVDVVHVVTDAPASTFGGALHLVVGHKPA